MDEMWLSANEHPDYWQEGHIVEYFASSLTDNNANANNLNEVLYNNNNNNSLPGMSPHDMHDLSKSQFRQIFGLIDSDTQAT